ncbi:hypothetical protein HZH66_010234 [Vespula vulgaris]|uniref:Uncharacterized protein n=1 Tax=Vespula vulgaris TaxID=7454 RepID=A0A834JL31_VESVU|nr:hypothetical protein HZH66_010234 [Vespula vulgaris]
MFTEKRFRRIFLRKSKRSFGLPGDSDAVRFCLKDSNIGDGKECRWALAAPVVTVSISSWPSCIDNNDDHDAYDDYDAEEVGLDSRDFNIVFP